MCIIDEYTVRAILTDLGNPAGPANVGFYPYREVREGPLL
jgi:hypothetical protein